MLGPEDLDLAVDVDICCVERRVRFGEGAAAEYWCLVSLPLSGVAAAPAKQPTDAAEAAPHQPNENGETEAAASGSEGANGIEQPASSGDSTPSSSPSSLSSSTAAALPPTDTHYLFWLRQEQWLAKKLERRMRKVNQVQQVLSGGGSGNLSHSSSLDGLSSSLAGEVERCAHAHIVTLFDGSALPACVDTEVRASLNASFERKWNSNSKQFQRTLSELTARLEAAAVELGATKDEYARYKSRAQTVLAHQQAELAAATSSIEALKVHESECAALREQLAALQADRNNFDPQRFQLLAQQLSDAQEALASQRALQREGKELLAGQISALEAQVAAEVAERARALQAWDEELRARRRSQSRRGAVALSSAGSSAAGAAAHGGAAERRAARPRVGAGPSAGRAGAHGGAQSGAHKDGQLRISQERHRQVHDDGG